MRCAASDARSLLMRSMSGPLPRRSPNRSIHDRGVSCTCVRACVTTQPARVRHPRPVWLGARAHRDNQVRGALPDADLNGLNVRAPLHDARVAVHGQHCVCHFTAQPRHHVLPLATAGPAYAAAHARHGTLGALIEARRHARGAGRAGFAALCAMPIGCGAAACPCTRKSVGVSTSTMHSCMIEVD